MKRCLVFIIAAAALAGTAAFMTGYGIIEAGKTPVSSLSSTRLFGAKFFSMPMRAAPEQVKIPVDARDASNVGSLEFELVYDPEVLDVTGVETGTLAANAMMESSVEDPGRVWVGMIDANGMNGDGSVAVISFRVIGKEEVDSPLIFESVAAHDAETLFEIDTETSPGTFATKNHSFTAPVIIFSPKR